MIEIFAENNKLSREHMMQFLGKPYEKMIKFVVDIQQRRIAMGGEMHADAEKVLMETGSRQFDLWGANIYPIEGSGKNLEYMSLINIRPGINPSMEIMDSQVRQVIDDIVAGLMK